MTRRALLSAFAALAGLGSAPIFRGSKRPPLGELCAGMLGSWPDPLGPDGCGSWVLEKKPARARSALRRLRLPSERGPEVV